MNPVTINPPTRSHKKDCYLDEAHDGPCLVPPPMDSRELCKSLRELAFWSEPPERLLLLTAAGEIESLQAELAYAEGLVEELEGE